MQSKKYIGVFLLMGSLIFGACNKYLDVKPKGYTTLSSTKDYDQWLNDGEKLGASATADLNLLADNVDKVNIALPVSGTANFIYTWASQFTNDLKTVPAFWGAHYSNINKYNTVLIGIDDASGDEQDKKSLKAEALLGRAFEYFYLVNLYGKPYDAATAATDLAVPFVTSNDVAQTVPDRSTVKEIYDHIINDIRLAIPALPKNNSKNRMRGSVAAAYSVLARVYLYMQNYAEAAKNAQLAIQIDGLTMIDFRIDRPASVRSLSTRPDAIYSRRLSGNEIVSLPFVQSYQTGDLRRPLLYNSSDNFTNRGGTTFAPLFKASEFQMTNTGTSLQEMKLIIAEAAAREEDLTTALDQLNDIRIMRLATANYQPLQSADKDEVLDWVLRERAWELPYSGLRWFDMRRFDKEGRMPVVNRLDAQNNIIATLQPGGEAYTLKIPLQVITFNPDMSQH